MKKIIIIACLLIPNVLLSFAQNKRVSETTNVEKILAAYKSEVKPYLQEMVDREYSVSSTDNDVLLLRNVKLARLHALKAHEKIIRKDVYQIMEKTKNIESVPASRHDSIPNIDSIVRSAYSMHYTGLPYEFYKKASDKANGN